MEKKVVNVSDALNLPFSAAVKAGDFVFVSGQVGHIDEKGKAVTGIDAQARLCFEKMKTVLEKAGSSMDEVVKVTIFLSDVNNFGKMNEVYKSYFPKDPPARSTVIAGMAMIQMLIEIDCIAGVSK
jgi:2-iminobutanoate/2-iminopropanoate deaminase